MMMEAYSPDLILITITDLNISIGYDSSRSDLLQVFWDQFDLHISNSDTHPVYDDEWIYKNTFEGV